MHTSTHELIAPDLTEIDFERRFGGIARLYGAPALARFRAAHVCVIGVGGVGSWIVEALARSAVGHLTLIDLDNVAESNINRQIQAMSDTIGKAKITALAERIGLINPFCQVTEVEDFIAPDNLEQLLGGQHFDYLVDAIDNARSKAALIAWCRSRNLPMLTIGSAGGQTDPTLIAVRDLAKTEQEPLLKRVRKHLRTDYGFPRGVKNKFNVDAVFSMEPLTTPTSTSETGEACDIGWRHRWRHRPELRRFRLQRGGHGQLRHGGRRACLEKPAPAAGSGLARRRLVQLAAGQDMVVAAALHRLDQHQCLACQTSGANGAFGGGPALRARVTCGVKRSCSKALARPAQARRCISCARSASKEGGVSRSAAQLSCALEKKLKWSKHKVMALAGTSSRMACSAGTSRASRWPKKAMVRCSLPGRDGVPPTSACSAAKAARVAASGHRP